MFSRNEIVQKVHVLIAMGIQEEVAVDNWQDALIQIVLDVF